MPHVAIEIQGGLFSIDLLDRVAATPDQVDGQRSVDFRAEGRLSEEIQATFSDATTFWRAFQARIARGKGSKTTITRETWIIPLLQELDFDLTFRSGAISHRLGEDPDAPPVHIVEPDQDLDKRGDAKQSPHALVQDYLNRSDALWGIVTNGKRLRLLRDTTRFSKPTYIEFDLEGMMEGGLYSEFVLFYRLVHATRFPRSSADAHECMLERYHQKGVEEGGRVRDKLRDGVKKALEILGTGFLKHQDSAPFLDKFAQKRLDEVAYYRQLLRFIYRLLFLMVAEERRLLFVASREDATKQDVYTRWYSVARLRDRADTRFLDDGESDLWEGLKETFRLFEDTAAASQLGLTALDGELFGRIACADLIDTRDQPGPRLTNAELLEAVWQLSTFEDTDGRRGRSGTRRRVSFAGLDVEELGSVYESLLDYHPRVELLGEQSKFELVAGSERKSTGSYYTPPALVAELIKSALEPVMAERLAKARTKEDKERALLSLKVCDPAAGSGHFLLAAARRIGRELARVRSGETEPNPQDHRRAVRDVIRRCIYAVDKNPLAVDLCKVALWIEGHSSGLPLSFLDNHVKNGDSLVGVLDLAVLETGVPDGAYTAVAGDDKKVATEVRKRNKAELKGALLGSQIKGDVGMIASAFAAIGEMAEATADEVHIKEAAYRKLRDGAEWQRAMVACDLWTAAFFAPLTEADKSVVPTTTNVWDAVSGRLPRGPVAKVAYTLAHEHQFFHWPLEFPEVLAGGGFDVVLGNPPWDVTQIDDKRFFELRAPNIAALPAAQRKVAIAQLANTNPNLLAEYEGELRASENFATYVHNSSRFPLTASGKVNLYSLFAELSTRVLGIDGRIGIVVQSGILTDPTNRPFYESIIREGRLLSFHDMINTEGIFPGIHRTHPRFCLLTLSGKQLNGVASASFLNSSTDHFADSRRHFELRPELLQLVNPNTHACPAFRSIADAALTSKIYSHHTVLLEEADAGRDPWAFVAVQNFFSHTTDSKLFLSERELQSQGAHHRGNRYSKGDATWMPLYEGKMVDQYDHRLGSFAGRGGVRGNRVLPPTTLEDYSSPDYEPQPHAWVSGAEIGDRLSRRSWPEQWLLVWKDVTTSVTDRTVSAAMLPVCATDDTLSIAIVGREYVDRLPCFLANLNSLVLDYVARQKVSGLHIRRNVMIQLPVLAPTAYTQAEVRFIQSRVIELTYTSETLKPFAARFGYSGQPFRWNSARRAELRADLDAMFAYLYGLTRRELEYILDPKAVMGEDYPSETFRVLKEDEVKEFGEYRTRRLVLQAWDRFVADGTFDVAKLREPQYIDRMAEELSATRARLGEAEESQRMLAARAFESPKPTLFVEGVTDAAIVAAAWQVYFPGEALPVNVVSANGTKEMGSLAGSGKALRQLLEGRHVLVLADNDAAGRKLITDGHVHKGGKFRQLSNGIHWGLLRPTDDFKAAMKTLNVPESNWPFTVEAAFPPALRRAAEKAGAWAFSGEAQADLFENAEVGRRIATLTKTLKPESDVYWYVMAPAGDAKDKFAAWVTAPAQRTEVNYAAFESVIRDLRDLLARLATAPTNGTRAA